jgi:GntR family transcriptional regulator / MocR family aminotransferase
MRSGDSRATRRRAPDAPDILLPLDPSAARSLYGQVYDGLREAIIVGRVPPGARLPSTRALAADLGVARNTVALAFDQLRTEGYVVGRRGGGTRVRDSVPDSLIDVRRRRGAPGAAEAAASGGHQPDDPDGATMRRGNAAPNRTHDPASPTLSAAHSRPRNALAILGGPQLSLRGQQLAAATLGLVDRGGTDPVPFRMGVPALETFPARLWARLTARCWRRDGVYMGDSDPLGEPILRAAIAAHVTSARGARCTPDQVFIVSGALQGLDLIARLFLDAGDAAWVENPGYFGSFAPIAAAGARIIAVPVDHEGLDVSAGERAAPDARLAYVTPSHQFPLGSVMSASRRFALLAWARRSAAWVVEDDYDSEFRYTGRPLPCLQGLDAEHRGPDEAARVLYIGTFSKTLVPGLRLGYLIIPDAVVDKVRAARRVIDRHPPTFAQGVLADFIGEGHYARHVRRVRALYAERQAILLDAAKTELDGLIDLTPDAAGLHLVGWLPQGVSDAAASDAALAHGIETLPLSRCMRGPSEHIERGALLLSYAGFDGNALRKGVLSLRRVLESSAMKLSS